MPREGMLTFARLRPLNRDAGHRRGIAYKVHRAATENEKITLELQIPEEQRNVFDNRRVARYKFTGVIEKDASQQDVYEAVALDTVSVCLRGFSGAIFMYGQTSSGKTWTITGRKTFKDRGIAPRAIRQLFGAIREAESSDLPVRYRVLASYLQIYENRVHDLLDISNRGKPVEEWATVSFRSDGEGNQVLHGLTTFEVDNEEDTLNLFYMGNSHRVMGETSTNRVSSRSHAIFKLAISSEREEESELGGRGGADRFNKEINTVVSRGELNLVDLAGREHEYSAGRDDYVEADSSVSAAAQGRREATCKQEGTNVNLSLTKLERVILSLKKPGSFVPYHECALTSVLRTSLGVSCRTVFVINLSVDIEDLPETIASCRFAQICRKVVSRPIADESLSPGQELRLLRREAADMSASLAVKEDLVRVLAEEIRSKQLEVEANAERLEALEATQAFHAKRVLTKGDKEACAVVAEALASGSDEASKALEGLDRVSALQCCRELQVILLHPPPSSPTKMFRDAMASASPLDEEFQDWKFCRERHPTRDQGKECEKVKHILKDNAQLSAERRYFREQNQTLKTLLQQRDTMQWKEDRIPGTIEQPNGVSDCPASGPSCRSSAACPSGAASTGTAAAAYGIWSNERAACDDSVSPKLSLYKSTGESSLLKPMDELGLGFSDDGRSHTSVVIIDHSEDTSAGIPVGPRKDASVNLGTCSKLNTTNDNQCVVEGDVEEGQGDKQDGQNSRKKETERQEKRSEDEKAGAECFKDYAKSKRYDDHKGEEADDKEEGCGRKYIRDKRAPREATGRSNGNAARSGHVQVLAAPDGDSIDINSSDCWSLASKIDIPSTTWKEGDRLDYAEEGTGSSSHRGSECFLSGKRADYDTPSATKDHVIPQEETDGVGYEGRVHSHAQRGRLYSFDFDFNSESEREIQEASAEQRISENPGTERMIARVRESEKDTKEGEAQVEADSSITTAEEDDTVEPAAVVDERNLRSNLSRSRGMRRLIGDLVPRNQQPLLIMSEPVQERNAEGFSTVVNPSLDSDRHSAAQSSRRDRSDYDCDDIDPSSVDEEKVPRTTSRNDIAAKTPRECIEKQVRRLLTRGDFFVMHGRFGVPWVRFVWTSTNLKTIFWRRGGSEEVLGSHDMSLFDSVHLEPTKKARRLTLRASATSTTAEKPADQATNHRIVFVGPRGRHLLSLEMDSGESEPHFKQDELETWYEAFKYAIRVNRAGVLEQIPQSKKNKPKSTVWSPIRSSCVGVARLTTLNKGSSVSTPLYATALNTGKDGRGKPRRTSTASSEVVELPLQETRHHALDLSPMATRTLSSTKSSLMKMAKPPKQCLSKKVDSRNDSNNSGRNDNYIRESGGGKKGFGGTTGRLASFRPSPIDTSNLTGFRDPTSPPATGKSGSSTPGAGHDREYEEAEEKKLVSELDTGAAEFAVTSSVVQTGIFTNSSSRDGTTSTLPPTGSKEGNPRQLRIPRRPRATSPTLFVDGPLETRELSSPRSRDGKVRWLRTIGEDVCFGKHVRSGDGDHDSVYDTSSVVQRSCGKAFEIAQNQGRDDGCNGKASHGDGIRQTSISNQPSGDRSKRDVGTVVDTVNHSSSARDNLIGDSLPCRTRPPLPRDGRLTSTDFAREKNLTYRMPTPEAFSGLGQAEVLGCNDRGESDGCMASSSPSSGASRNLTDNATVASTSIGASNSLHDERDRTLSSSASQGMYRMTARRLSALGEQDLDDVRIGGETTTTITASSTKAKVVGARVLRQDSPSPKKTVHHPYLAKSNAGGFLRRFFPNS